MCKQESDKWKKIVAEDPECKDDRCKVTISEEYLRGEILKILCPQGAGDWAYATSKKRIDELIELFKKWKK